MGVVFPNISGGSKRNIKKLYDLVPDKSISFEEFYNRYNKYKVGEITREIFWAGITKNIDDIEHLYLDSYILDKNLNNIVMPLKNKYRIVALTNHPSNWIWYLRQKHGLDTFFEEIFVSGELKFKKTENRMYQKVIDKLGVNVKNCILIDDQKKNLAVAKTSGIKTIYLKNGEDKTDFKPDAEINSLEELKNIIYKI